MQHTSGVLLSPQKDTLQRSQDATREHACPIITVEHLVKRYKREVTNAVDDISFTVAPGSLFALLGPNGAGKTTTISILTTTLSPTSGKVLIAGYDVAKQPKGEGGAASHNGDRQAHDGDPQGA
ncbi:hypothetical protein KSC_030840 [Ktedonobacter sp. SOSP1-52]|nr:ATP-binding cassette domain-containing protein [Ktedonobacter sp. SOSP1-52]GHO64192.1 hypothetical protein KSC_030840 [Ktedonobacter sp. SOSP1-52]